MTALISFLRKFSELPVLLASASLFILMVMTFCDVILRSTFNAPIEAATELTRILMAIMVFAVMPIISARKEHIAVDLTDSLFHALRLSRIRDGLLLVVCGGMLYWPVQRIFVLADRAFQHGETTEYLAIPQGIITSFVGVATAVTGVVMVATGLLTLFAPKMLEPTE
ncbi:TRAP transporter small permease [Cochlodiniinecator piscidefendens]|uniref:TRAP transporter small permease n=1 Tax=Cochlodiniinecator piscidefendens TaxID=2715756 RepID=UPI001408D3DC|nr:TRAP transporter small permease subunit [Cochlodiniinecator piscidefendens]